MFNLISLLIGAGLFVASQLTPCMKICVSQADLFRRGANKVGKIIGINKIGNKVFGKNTASKLVAFLLTYFNNLEISFRLFFLINN